MTEIKSDEEQGANLSKEEAPAESPSEEPVEEPKEEETEVPSKKEIDFKAMKEAEESRGKPDAEKARLAFLERERKRKEKEESFEEEDDDEDKPLTRREMLVLLDERENRISKMTLETRALEIARANSSSEEEAQAAFTFWKTRVIPSGNLEDDVRFAVGGINHSKVISVNKELARALNSKENASKETASTFRDAPQGSEPKMSSIDAAGIKSAGYVWDGAKRLYKKPLGKGNSFLYYDPKSKKTWRA